MNEIMNVPESCEAEQSVLGALLMFPDALDRIDWLPAESFFRGAHRIIYAGLRTLIESGKAVDVFLLSRYLESRRELEQVGGQHYLVSLQINTSSAVNIHLYAGHVRDAAILRGLMTYACDLQDMASTPGAVPEEVLEHADSGLFRLQTARAPSETRAFHHTLDAALMARTQAEHGLGTGFVDVDALVKRMKGGDLVIVAGRPSMGKSAFATCVAEHNAWTEPVAFFSLEMSRASIGERILSWHERRHGQDEAIAKLTELQLFIETPSALSIGTMRLKLRRQQRKHGLSLAVVDYLQLMRGIGENRTQEIGSISRGLKQLAVEFDIPIIAVCQINRAVEQRPDKRPLLSDLRESGDIEQDSDVVLMVYREEYYNRSTPAVGTAEILIRKQRNGDVGFARLTFIGEYARFENYGGPPICNAPAPVHPVSNFNDYKTKAAGE